MAHRTAAERSRLRRQVDARALPCEREDFTLCHGAAGAADVLLCGAAVLDRALRQCQGKSIINSVNLEDGEERFERVVPLARQFGAALIVGCIDEDKLQGMAVTRDRKLAVPRD